MLPKRIYLFLIIFMAWLWAGSVFAIWSESLNPRLWLYDLLFYTRFVLLYWGCFEFLWACRQLQSVPDKRKRAIASACVLAVLGLGAATVMYLMASGGGWKIKVQFSAEELGKHRVPVHVDQRQRIGWFLIDNRRNPCRDEPWLWLGEVYGGGTGNNMALVYSKRVLPKTPSSEAFRFWPLTDHWWLAYQNPKTYFKNLKPDAPCVDGQAVATHGEGVDFIKSSSTN